jgi:hypothetical protein
MPFLIEQLKADLNALSSSANGVFSHATARTPCKNYLPVLRVEQNRPATRRCVFQTLRALRQR